MYGYSSHCVCGGYGCRKCCVPQCYPPPSCPPQVTGNWSFSLKNIVGPGGTCPPNDVTESQPIVLALNQCPKPDDAFVIATVSSGPTGPNVPIIPGDELLGIFHKDSKKCYTLKLVSSTESTTFEINFLGGYCPKKANYSYIQTTGSGSVDSSAVGGGCATKKA